MHDKSDELAHQFTRVYWLEEDNACLLNQIGAVNALVGHLEERGHMREEEEVEAQAAELRQNVAVPEQRDKALEAKEAELQCKEAELQGKEVDVTSLTETLMQKDVVLAAQEVAIRDVEAALKEKEASLFVLQEQADAARAHLEKEQERTEGK